MQLSHFQSKFLCLVFLAFPFFCSAQTTVFTDVHLIPIVGEEIENGTLIIENGKIKAVGAASEVSIPKGAEVVSLSGKVLMPGLVDSHSHIGNGDGGDRSSPLHPDVRIFDAIDVHSDTFKKARAGGVTTVNVMPGSGHLMSGQTVYLKLRPATTIDDMLLNQDPDGILGGMKMANGTNSLREPPFPGTRAKSAAMVRSLFVKAQEYQAKMEDADGDESKIPARDLEMEALVEVLEGKRMVHNHTHRHDDIMTAMRLADEFGYRLVLHHISEGWKLADEIARAGIPCSIIVLDSPGGKMEAVDLRFDTGAILEKAGVDVGYHTDDWINDSRLFLRSAAFGVRGGMSRAKALEAVTLANARMLDAAERVGSLEPGKDADFIVLSGDPLSVYTLVEQTWVEGQKVFDRANPEDLKYATGGLDVFRGEYYNHHEDFNQK
ncbi:MAG: amidohydrolase family protein [Flavobacteriales bacterium]|nr:amidohydrolase family protein [Flavobacteriales bacterium]